MIEPIATAAVIALFGVLLTISALMTGTLNRLGVPVVLLFLGLGMLAGSEGVGGLAFDDADFAFRIGTVALVLILLDGGLNTRWASIRSVAAPAGLLATVGVDSPVAGKTLRDLTLPDSIAVVLIVRGDEPLAPRGSTKLQADDLLYILCPVHELGVLRGCFDPASDGEACLIDRMPAG